MKNLVLKASFFLLLLSFAAADANAQRPSRRRNNNPPATNNANSGTETSEQVNQTRPPSGYNPYGNIPIEKDSTGASDTAVKASLRNDNAYDKSALNDRTPLNYEHLRWDDALFAEKVWREIDLREKINQSFRYAADENNGSQLFMNILLKAVNTGQVTAFSDERFTTPMTLAEVQQLTAGQTDTVPVTDINDPNKVVKYKVTSAQFDAKTVMKLRIKEEWVFDREASRMFVRILGICPLKSREMPAGPGGRPGQVSDASTPMFWLYYPDLRPILARYEVYNPKNMGASRMTWEELFEARMFSSYITKSTLDNPGNKNVRQMIKDPILALLEGDNIKERIFNYEQDLWSY
ncbi:gliding motility protein GldN [Flaviaesturariibacter aridisoli]|nr:gliding motility protein GldN [Flaviaesturariibacter aridisoli]